MWPAHASEHDDESIGNDANTLRGVSHFWNPELGRLAWSNVFEPTVY